MNNASVIKPAQPLGYVGSLVAEMFATGWTEPFIENIPEHGCTIGTSTGTKRARNEDRAAIASVAARNGERYCVALLCDGVGGSSMGDAAAGICIAAIIDGLSKLDTKYSLDRILSDLVRYADDVIRDELRGKGQTTLSALLASSRGECIAINVGDSRIFSWDGRRSSFVQISRDDTIENELAALPLLDQSMLDERGLRGTLSQALGEVNRSATDLRLTVLTADHFGSGGAVLASDGAWKGAEQAFLLIASHSGKASDLVRRTLSVAAWTGGLDNVSVVAIENCRSFAAGNAPDLMMNYKEAGTTVWIRNTKLVIRDSWIAEERGPSPQQPKHVKRGKELTGSSRPKRKSASRKRASLAGPQLDGLKELPETSGAVQPRLIGLKQKVVITTDDEDGQ